MILIGFMGAGKTTVGKALSDALNLPFYDLDLEIINEIQMPIADFFAIHGETAFRQLEADYLENYADKTGVISTGGGCIETEINRDLLVNRNDVIYLQADYDTLVERIQNDSVNVRPTAKNKSYSELEKVLLRRLDFYQECADHIITTDQLSIDEIVQEIILSSSVVR